MDSKPSASYRASRGFWNASSGRGGTGRKKTNCLVAVVHHQSESFSKGEEYCAVHSVSRSTSKWQNMPGRSRRPGEGGCEHLMILNASVDR